VGEGQARQKLSKSLRTDRRATNLLVPIYNPQMQTKIHQTASDANPNAKIETSGTVINRADEEKGRKARPDQVGKGPHSGQHLAKNIGVTDGEVKNRSLQGHLQLQPKDFQ
jgi:hypothetical protein